MATIIVPIVSIIQICAVMNPGVSHAGEIITVVSFTVIPIIETVSVQPGLLVPREQPVPWDQQVQQGRRVPEQLEVPAQLGLADLQVQPVPQAQGLQEAQVLLEQQAQPGSLVLQDQPVKQESQEPEPLAQQDQLVSLVLQD